MAFDFDKVKESLSAQKLSAVLPARKEQKQPAAKKQSSNPIIRSFKQGIEDIRAVFAEGNYKLFLKQFCVVVLAFLGLRFLLGKLNAQKAVFTDRISAISIQQTNQTDYLDNKDRLLRLEPMFPDLSAKNEWLLRAIMSAFDTHKIHPNIDGNVTENVGNDYTVVSQPVNFQQKFADLGKFLADVESGDDFLRVSELTLNKVVENDLLGFNAVTLRFNTVFPKEKYGPKLFKDYAEQIQKREKGKAAS